MRGKRFKLLYFSMGGSEVKQISFSWNRIFVFGLIGLVMLTGVSVLIISSFTGLFHNWKIDHLTQSKSELEFALADLENKVRTIENHVQYLEKNDEDLRIFLEMPTVDSDMRKLGRGGLGVETFTPYLGTDEVRHNELQQIQHVVENLSQRINFAKRSREEITQEYNDDLTRLSHTPSVRPLVGGRKTANYGPRLDPITGRHSHHEGVDFSAARGTDVYATADGVVIEAKNRYTPNKSYGRYVLIDHGDGKCTRYAHLSKILVRKGQTIKRYDIIGKVGDTGKSTGPHLHYEVVVDGQTVDPMNHILD